MYCFKRNYGFTIVELLIIIIVIGVLATITIVGYNSFTDRAVNVAMEADLKSAADKIELAKTYANSQSYPSTFPSDVKASDGVVLQMTATDDPKTYCINAYSTADTSVRMSFGSQGESAKSQLCPGLPVGPAIGGTVPKAPRGVNLMPDLSTWELANGATYNPTTKEITLGTTTASAKSPPVRIDSSASIRTGIDVYATASAPNFSPDGGLYWGTSYFGSDGVTPVKNTAGVGYTGNGNAQRSSLNAWQDHTWPIQTGPNVIYVRITINTSTSSYTGLGNKYRNPTLLATD